MNEQMQPGFISSCDQRSRSLNRSDRIPDLRSESLFECPKVLWMLGHSHAEAFDQVTSDTQVRDWAEFNELEQTLSQAATGQTKIVIIDVGLSANWPPAVVDQVCDAVSLETTLVFVCNSSEVEGYNLMQRCQRRPKTHVIMGEKFSGAELRACCECLLAIEAAAPQKAA